MYENTQTGNRLRPTTQLCLHPAMQNGGGWLWLLLARALALAGRRSLSNTEERGWGAVRAPA